VVVGESTPARARIVRVATLLGGIYFFLYFLLPEAALEQIGIAGKHDKISNGFIAIGAMAIGLGLINIIASHGAKVAFRRTGWVHSIALLGGLGAMLVVTAGQWIQGLSVTSDIKRVQIISEFAQRIIEDEAVFTAATSIRPVTVPVFSERVAALSKYTREVLAELEQYALQTEGLKQEEARAVLLEELRQSIATTQGAVQRVEDTLSDAVVPSLNEPITVLGTEGSKLAGTYFVLRRLDREKTLMQRLYDLFYNGLFNQLGSAMFALLGVYIAAAAYRAFRIKTVESALMLL
jgi:hypothetical protein